MGPCSGVGIRQRINRFMPSSHRAAIVKRNGASKADIWGRARPRGRTAPHVLEQQGGVCSWTGLSGGQWGQLRAEVTGSQVVQGLRPG